MAQNERGRASSLAQPRKVRSGNKRLSALCDSVGGANLCAAAAADALVRVDVVDVAGSDCSYGANGLAGSASYTVVANYVSHSCV